MADTEEKTKPRDKKGDEKILEQARDDFKRCADAEAENREQGLEDLRFARLSDQWPEAIRRKREADGRPCLTINRLPAFIRQVVNDSRQNKPAVQVHPVDSQADPKTADILSGLIRNIEYASDADVAYDTAVECAVTTGFGYFRIATEYAFDDAFDLDIVIKRIANQFTVYGDPDSTAADSSDWNVAFVTDMYTKTAFEERWPKAEAVDFDAGGYSGLEAPWRDGDQVMVAEYWTREKVKKTIYKLSSGEVVDEARLKVLALQEEDDELDMELTEYVLEVMGMQIVGERETDAWKVTQRIISGCEVLETNEWGGRYIPIIPVYGDEVNEEGKRHFRSLIRDAKDPQRMFNFWRTSSTELVALAPRTPWIGKKGQFDADPNWQTANTESHAYLEYEAGEGELPPQRQPLDGGPAIGAMQEALSAGDDMKAIIGIYDAGLGQRSNEVSGVAIKARQREGDVSTFHFIDNLSRGIRHAGRVLIDLIPTVYNGQRMIRILGEDKKAATVPLNTPVAPDAVPGAQTDDQMPEGAMRIFDLGAGKYDVTVEAGPSFSTRREEAATQMMEFVQAFPAAAPIIGDLFAASLDWPGATEIAARLKTLLPPEVQGQNPVIEQGKKMIEQLQQQLQATQQQAMEAINKLKDEREIDMNKVRVDAYNAETNRLKVTATAMGPAEVHALVMQTLQQVLTSPDVLTQGAPPQMQAPPPPQQQQPIPQPGPQPGFFSPPVTNQ